MKRLLLSAASLAISLSVAVMSAGAYTTPALPLINTNNVINVTNATYGAKGDGVTTNTSAIQKAIVAASGGLPTNGLSGGTVEVPPGVYMCGPLVLGNNVNLQLDAGAVLRLLPFGQYPGGIVNPSNFISGKNLHDLEISGTGAIDGQGAPWWPYANTNGANRPNLIAPSGCSRFLIQDITMSNSPQFHIAMSGSMANATVQRVRIRAPSSSDPVTPGHNTDACDVSGTNILVQNCDISVGDDNFTCGGTTSDVLITNNTYGNGHGVSIGSYTSPGVSNITVINCTFNGTDQGIRIKTDRDRGGLVRNISYYNLSMTNVQHPILIYCQYTNTTAAYRALDSITPSVAASYPSATNGPTTPRFRDITISNITATTQSGRGAGLIWGLPESWMTNITLIKVNITASKSFGIYEARNVKFIDCTINVPAGVKNIACFNTDLTISNSTPSATMMTLDGLDGSNSLAVYGAPLAMTSTDAFAAMPLTVSGCVLSNSGSLTLPAGRAVNFALGTTASKIVVSGGLTLNGTVNITNAAGFGLGNYTLFSYTGSFSGTPVLGAVPAGFNYNLDTGTFGQVNLNVSSTGPCTNPTVNVSGGATICAGGVTTISAAMTGTSPWKLYWSDGVVLSGVHLNPVNRGVAPSATTTYTVTNVTDATGCAAGTMSGSAVITVNPRPTAVVSGGGTICNGGSTMISAALSGSPPWNVTWSDSFVQNGVAASPAIRTVSPSVMTTYSVTGLTDSNCAAQGGDLSGSAMVTVNASPTASVGGGGTICGGDSASVSAALTGTPPWSVTWSDGFVQPAIASSPATRNVSPAATTTYTVTALGDANGCAAGSLSGSALVTVCNPPLQIGSARFLDPDHLELTWNSVSNHVYQVESADSENGAQWVTNATLTATDSTTSWTNSGVSTVTQRFYRVVDTP